MEHTTLRKTAVAVALSASSLMATFAHADFQKDWSKSNENNAATIDHSQWQKVLDNYLVDNHSSGVNLFNYNAVTQQDRALLQSYLNTMQAIDPRGYRKDVQKAYWINLYNALTVELILENYPVKTITKLGESFFTFGPWGDDIATVGNQTLTLNNIEHDILRPIWQDPRIHYAVNCASFSCPNLSGTAYTAANMNALLEEGAKDYVNHSRGVSLNGDELTLSSIYKWYVEDFGGEESTLLEHLIDYANPPLKNKLSNIAKQNPDIDYDYNWNLNEIR